MTFSSALSTASYEVVVTATSITDTGNNDCVYWRITSKTTTGFTIEQRRCSDSNLRNTGTALTLGWIAFTDN